jgi:hypothetical protein
MIEKASVKVRMETRKTKGYRMEYECRALQATVISI